MRPPARSLPGMTTVPRQDPCRGPDKTLAEDACGSTARPASIKTPPLFPCSCQPDQLGRHLRGNMRLTDQPSKHLSSLPAYMALHASLAWTRGGAAMDGTGLVAIHNKATGHLRGAFNAPCPIMTGDKLVHCILSTSCVPLWQPLLSIKGGSRHTGEGFKSFGTTHAP